MNPKSQNAFARAATIVSKSAEKVFGARGEYLGYGYIRRESVSEFDLMILDNDGAEDYEIPGHPVSYIINLTDEHMPRNYFRVL